MSYNDGWAAMRLEMPPRVPRFEPSAAEYHWPLIRAVTGLDVALESPAAEKMRATEAFVRAWNYDIYFGALIHADALDAKQTRMGHAQYAERGADYDDRLDCPFTGVEEVFSFDPFETYGDPDHAELVARFNAHYRERCERFPNCVNMTGIYITLMSGMIAVFGWDLLLLAAGTDPDRFGATLDRWAGWIGRHYAALADCEAPVLYCHDDMVWTEGPFISPGWYRKYLFPNLEKLWAPAVAAGKKIIYVGDGNWTAFADDIAACGNHGFWFEIFTDLETLCQRFGETHVIIGNGDVRPLTFGDRNDIRAEVARCMNIGKRYPGYFMCMSGHIPPNVPVENALYYNDIYEQLSRR